MLLTALFVGLVALAAASPTQEPIQLYYHESVGIQEAERIKQLEQAVDFDGSRIVGGSAAALGTHPHLGGLVITLTTGATSVCGSSLLSNNRLVTAAHCWWDGRSQGRQLVVVLGSRLLFSGGSRFTTSNVAMHGNWNPNTAANDVAIITIFWVAFSANINRVAIATDSSQYVGSASLAAGYGRTSDSAGITNNQAKRHVSLVVISNVVCQQTFGNLVRASTLCTSGVGGIGICGGDSGGPLTLALSNTRTLIGIASFTSARGCQAGLPSAFARVSSFAAWIQARI